MRDAKWACAEVVKLGAPKRPVTQLGVMLAEPRPQAVDADGWIYELKYDGYRVLAQKNGATVRLIYRSGRDATALFPELVAAVAALPVESAILDGETCVVDPNGRTDFNLMQQRGQLQRGDDVRRMAAQLPVTYFAFDLLELDGHDVRPLPLLQRKSLLEAVLHGATATLRYSGHVDRNGTALFAEVEGRGLEGVVGKRAQSAYRAGRWPDWIKVTTRHFADFAVVGYSEPDGARSGFGALHLALRDGEQWVYSGKVGSGFSDKELSAITKAVAPLRRPKPICIGEVPRGRGNHWIEPKLVAEVRYKEWPVGGFIRAPIFLRLRDDKRADECTVRQNADDAAHEVTNRDKIFWPDEGITKGELVDYYERISPWILPYLKDRPVMLTRFPDGIRGKSFFQNNVPAHAPEWVRRELMWNEERTAKVQHFVCDDVKTLTYVANLGSIPLHLWSARAFDLEHPDWCILDLDPKTAPFSDVVTLALAIKKLCDELDLPSYPKTSGGSGLHVLIPLGRKLDHVQATSFAEVLARVIVQRHPKIASMERAVVDRKGKVYVDYLQNGFGRLLAAPFCVRPVGGARVSAPLRWREVNAKLDPAAFTIHTLEKRMKRLGEDPLAPVLNETADVPRALERLMSLQQR